MCRQLQLQLQISTHPFATPQQAELCQPSRADAAGSRPCCVNVLASNWPRVLRAVDSQRSIANGRSPELPGMLAVPAALLLLAGQPGMSPTSSSDARAAMLRLICVRVDARLDTTRHGEAPCSTGLLPVLRVLLSERC